MSAVRSDRTTNTPATPPFTLRVQAKASGIDALVLDHVPQAQPVPKVDEVVVAVKAAAINPSDVKATLGIMPKAVFPRTPGRDYAGVVVAGPADLLGTEVWGSGGDVGITRDGSHGRFLLLPRSAVIAKPKALSMAEAGSVGVPFVTAYEGLRRAGFFANPNHPKTVAVFGANGKVGQAAVQLAAQQAQRTGAQVIAVQRQDALEGFACGPVRVVNARPFNGDSAALAAHLMELTNGRGVDVAYNTVDSVYFQAANAVMAKGATHIFIIATKGQTVPFDVFSFYRGMHSFMGIDTLAFTAAETNERLAAMRAGFEDGTLKPFPVALADALPLSRALEGYRAVLAGAANRIVLVP
jgi:NADPH:quinone reductase-like Zn-dependent oxidoreductase